jgi:CysZ protein
MLSDIFDSLADVASPPLRRILYKSLALTLAALFCAWLALDALAVSLVVLSGGWLATLLHVAIGLGLVLVLALLAAPTVSAIAGFFLDDVAAIVEAKIDPMGRRGRPAPLMESLGLALAYAPLALLISLLAVVLLFVPGLGLAAWLAANAYVLGRQYFEMCALRFSDVAAVRAARREHRLAVFVYGLPVAVFVAVPLLNLATPLFAAALMARLVNKLAKAPAGVLVPSPRAAEGGERV